MQSAPDFESFAVNGATLGALRWPGIDGGPTVVAIHGITANAWAWDPVAHHLNGGVNLIAIDLRGRGRSWEEPGPFGIRRHCIDVIAIIEQLDVSVTVVAHSMGTYVALMAAQRHPDLINSLVLVDGGTPLFVPDRPLGQDGRPIELNAHIDQVLDVSLGPVIDRLERVWPDRVSYQAMWGQHPAFGDGISSDLERNLLADLVDVDPHVDGSGFRVGVNVEAVRVDGRDILADADVRSALGRCTVPTTMIRAEFGLMGTPPPLIADETIDAFPQHQWIRADGLNHYTVMNSTAGASMVADAIRSAVAISVD